MRLIHAEQISLYNFIVLSDTSEDQTSQVRHSKSMGICGFSYMAEMARKSYSSQENPEILIIK